MPILADAEALLPALTRGEKASLLQTIAHDLGDSFPGIDKDPAVCGGEACIVRTRIPVWTLVRARQLGLREVEILRSYPTLRAEDLANAWTYQCAHAAEIAQAIVENEAD